MCGIAGALRVHEQSSLSLESLRHAVASMSEGISHRGPDDHGTWIHEQGALALAHRRLSIVDLSARGHQPMSYKDRFVIVFNGELYNFRELRAELCTYGHSFVSDTDTEVLMASVQQWGIADALRRLTGMFAFALWDREREVLYLARDRMGEKPLFVRIVDGYLAFGSELRALERFGSSSLDLSEVAVGRYLLAGYVSCPASMWEGIYKIPAACYLTIRADTPLSIEADHAEHTLRVTGGASIARYWDLYQTAQSNPDLDEEGALDRLQSLLGDAVHSQMQCDVPVGVFLSGGIDSTAVAALAQAQSSDPVSTFTVRFAAPGFDESEHAAAVAGHLRTRHHEIDLSPEQLLRDVPSMAASLDEPTANASYFPLLAMSTQARRHVKVILSGDGGDELFGGYNRYHLTPLLWGRIGWMPAHLRLLVARMLAHAPFTQLLNAVSSSRMSGQVSGAVAAKKLARTLRSRTLGESYTNLMRCWDSIDRISTAQTVPFDALVCSREDFLERASRFDVRSYLPDDNLAKADRATMAAGIEGRIPLLDHRVVEFAFSLPEHLKLNAGASKWLLRKLAYRFVPRTLLDRPKMGFTVPVNEWLKGPLRGWAEDLLNSDLPYDRGYLRKGEVLRSWAALQKRDAPLAWEMWAIVIYSAWLHGRAAEFLRS